MSNVPISNLPSVTSAQSSSQIPAVQAGTTVYLTVDQIAKYTQTTYPITGITSITAQSPLSGGTITSTGTIGLTTGNLTNNYLANMPSNTIKGNNTGSSATPLDLTPSQVLSMIGAGTVSYVATGTGLTGGPITTTGTISIANTGVTAGTYGSATAVPQIAINAQGQITSASRVNILIPTSQITGLGTMATQNANAVAITGGTVDQTTIGGTTAAAGTFTNLTATGTVSIGTISSGTWQGTPIAVAYGGTGATSASAARTNLSAAQSGANSDITSLTGLTTPLAETEGGTGYGSYTTGDILYASSSSTLARLNDVATGNALISGGVGVAPSYGKIGLTTHVTGTLPVANGGTGATTLTGYLVGNGTSAVTAVATIPNAGLTNSSVTIGSTAISLGASTSTLAGLTTVTVTQDPTSALQLSTKQYVDGQVAAVSNTTFHTSVAAATTANLTATYNNGTAGVGATLTNSGTQAAFSVDGYSASLNDRILVKDMTTAAYNGIYTVTTVGSGSTNWVLTRATDFNTVGTGPNYIETGAATFITGGTTWGSTSWVMNTTGTITVGSTSLNWVQTSSAGNIQVTAPITKTGNTIGLSTVGVTNGGTGLTTLTAYGLLYAPTTSSVGQISPSTSGYPLLSTGASSAPAFGQLALGGAGVTGTLGVTNGGTGTNTSFTTGSVVFAGASGVYSQNNTKFFWDNTNNRLGVNTGSPNVTLAVVSNTQTASPLTSGLPAGTDLYIMGANGANTRITQDAFGTGAYGVYTARSARGTAASPTAIQSGDFLAQFTGRGYGATGFATASTGYLAITAAENFTDTAQGTYASIYTTATGGNSATEAFRFGPAGQLGIGGATYGTSGQFLLSGGASAAPAWTTVTLATLGGVVPVASGGTNITSYTVGDLLYASASTTLSKLSDVATGSVLVSGGVGVAPAWSNSPTVTALTTGSVSNSGNETFTGTGARILGDFTNATITNRLAFQTSTSNSTTGIYALPNGTSTAASWQATNAADPTNASKILIATNGSTDVQLVSGINGTGTYLPLSFWTNGTGQFVINTSGALGIGPTATASYGTSGQVLVSGGSSAQPSWSNVSGLAVTSINFGTTGLTPSTATQGAVTVAGTLVTGNGGTGLTTFTAANNAIYSTSASALTAGTLPVAAGGTGLATTPANGALDIGNGTNFTRTTLTAGTAIGVTNGAGSITINNTGVTSAVAGTAISVSGSTGAVTINNTGVTSAAAGTGISVSASTGGVTITNSGVTSIVAGTNISISGGTGAVTINSTATAGTGRLIRAPQILTSGTSYTTPSNCNSIYVECVGGGGGGGGTGANFTTYGAGGGGGGYTAKYFSVSPSTAYTYAIGSGGTAGAAGSGPTVGGTGGTGGSTTFTVSGTTITASGGSGGSGTGTAYPDYLSTSSGGTGTNGDLNIAGNPSIQSNGTIHTSGGGGGSIWGGAGKAVVTSGDSNGTNGGSYGGGGSGACTTAASGWNAGGSGYQGVIRIWEYT